MKFKVKIIDTRFPLFVLVKHGVTDAENFVRIQLENGNKIVSITQENSEK